MAAKKFPYAVIYGGKLIPANTPIEMKKEKTEDKKTEDKKTED